MRRGPTKFFWRLGLVLMISQLVIAVIAGFYATKRVRTVHYEDTLRDLKETSYLVAELCRERDLRIDRQAFDRSIKLLGHGAGVRITVTLDDGTVIADSIANPSEMENHRSRKEIAAAFDKGVGEAQRRSATIDEEMMYFARRIDGPDHLPVVVRASLQLTAVDEQLARTTRVVALAGGASILLTLIVIYIVSLRFGMQISGLADGARKFASGDLDHRIPRSSTREFAQLGDSLNTMALQLGERIRQLQTQQQEQRTILQSMSNGVIALDLNQRITNINRAAVDLIGIDIGHAYGRLLQEVMRHPELHRFVEDALSHKGVGPVEMTLGGEQELKLQAVSEHLVAPDGTTTGLLIVFNDVTRLRRLESLRSDFAANVSHELRTPITNIKGYVETLQEVGWDDHRQAERFLDIIGKNASRLAAIVEDVMALTKLERPDSREQLDRHDVPIRNIIGAVISQFEGAAAAKDITLTPQIENGLTASVHSQMIEQAIGNLVSNAVAYSPLRTTVVISGSVENGEIVLAVTDEGPGIEKKHLTRIFERFYRADKARSRELGGTGLGLAIVKHIALLHGGRAEVDSQLGRGSTFRLILPAL